MYEIHFLASEERLEDSLQEAIREIVEEVYSNMHTLLSLKECKINFIVKKNSDDPNVFRVFGGDVDSFYISVDRVSALTLLDSDKEVFTKGLSEHLYSGLYETARANKLENTVGDCLFDEVIEAGLVAHFIEEVTGSRQKHHDSISPEELSEMKEKLREICANGLECDINSWFKGSDSENLPPQAVSIVGYHIVDTYLSKGDIKSTDVLGVPACKFVIK